MQNDLIKSVRVELWKAPQSLFIIKGCKDSIRADRGKLYPYVLCRDGCSNESNRIGNW